MNIYFDLDGTLLDSRERLYNLFVTLVPSANMTIHEYWELKRNKCNHKNILTKMFNYTDEEFNTFEKDWLNKIEMPEYLQYDTPVDGVFDTLYYLFKKYTLNIVTARQNRHNLLLQLEYCKLNKYFNAVVATENKFEKKDLIKSLKFETGDFIVGDTGHDIQTGICLCINTIAVSYGFMKKEILETYKPQFLINRLQDIKNIL